MSTTGAAAGAGRLPKDSLSGRGGIVTVAMPIFVSVQGSGSSKEPTGKTVKLGELFCGAGGMALGASMAEYEGWHFEHAWATDRDLDSCRTIRQVPVENVVQEDIKNLDFHWLKDKYGPIDGLVFGFPCNDFSVVGERRGVAGEYGALYQYGVAALDALNPLFFVAENVSGLSSVNNKSDFEKILRELRKAGKGYKVVEHLYKFEEYGVPQRRHRYIIVGFRADAGINFVHPAPTGGKVMTAAEALSNLPEDTPNNDRTAQNRRVMQRLEHIKPGENAFTASLPPDLQLNMRSGALISQIYRRLLPDEPSYTVTGSGGGGTHLYHWDEPRALTNRERARLQSFPDSYVFAGRKESVRKQVGMAVPPEGAKVVFQSLLRTIVNHWREATEKC